MADAAKAKLEDRAYYWLRMAWDTQWVPAQFYNGEFFFCGSDCSTAPDSADILEIGQRITRDG